MELTSTLFTLQRFGPSPSPNFKSKIISGVILAKLKFSFMDLLNMFMDLFKYAVKFMVLSLKSKKLHSFEVSDVSLEVEPLEAHNS